MNGKNSEKEDHIQTLEREVQRAKDSQEEWNIVHGTLEEALKIKDEALKSLQLQQENLQREFVKLNAATQLSSNRNQLESDQNSEKVKLLENEIANVKAEKENLAIKVDENNAQVEGIEILFGFSTNDESLIEQLSCYKFDSNKKLKELERQIKNQEFENNDISRNLVSLEKVMGIPTEKDMSFFERLDNIKNGVLSFRDDEKLNQHHVNELEHTKKELQDLLQKSKDDALKINDLTDELVNKEADCNDLTEENQELKDEINDLKDQLNDVVLQDQTDGAESFSQSN